MKHQPWFGNVTLKIVDCKFAQSSMQGLVFAKAFIQQVKLFKNNESARHLLLRVVNEIELTS